MPTYSESAKDHTISKSRAMKEIKDHCCDMAEFLCEMGDHDEYEASEVLSWLGY